MEDIRTLHLKILHGQLTSIVGGLTHVQFRMLPMPQAWSPRLNVYRCAGRLAVCVELAGIDRSDIRLQVEPRRVWLSGWRRAPIPDESEGPMQQILALEIDEGRFAREIALPVDVVPEAVRAEQRNGLLWIDLPLDLPNADAPEASP